MLIGRCPEPKTSQGVRRLPVLGLGSSGAKDCMAPRTASLADARLYDANAEWLSVGADVWRSGIKHDCSRIMELEVEGESLRNSTGEFVDVEPDLLYPMLKSSEVHRGLRSPGKTHARPQRAVGESTSWIRTELPRTWAYLEAHADAFDGRRSAIYAKGPRFSIFGVGPYSFTDWKIAISALYKDLAFQMYGPREGRPIVFDDTVNLLACDSEDVAQGLIRTYQSHQRRNFSRPSCFGITNDH